MSLGRVPVILQFTPTECSAACLAMALGVHGRETTLEEIRESFAPGRDGASALALIEAGTRFGLAGEGVEATVDDLADLPRGTILFWERKHFVVLESATPKGVRIVDPASGRRFLPRAEAEAAFSNVAIMFEPTPELVRGRGARSAVLELLWDALRRHKTLLGVAAFSLVVQLLFAALPLATGRLIDRVLPAHDKPALWLYVVGCAVATAIFGAAAWVRGRLLVRARLEIDEYLSTRFVHHVLGLPFDSLQRRSAGDLVARLASISTIRQIMASGMAIGIVEGVSSVIHLAVLSLLFPVLTIVVVAMAILQLIIVVATKRLREELASNHLSQDALIRNFETHVFAGVETVKGMGAEDHVIAGWRQQFDKLLEASRREGMFEAATDGVVWTIRGLSFTLPLLFSAWMVMNGKLSIGAMVAATALATTACEPLLALSANMHTFAVLRGYLRRIADLLNSPLEEAGETRRPAPPLRGDVTVKDLSFRYSPAGPRIVDEVSVQIRAGQMIGIVGPSGAGKSTFARLLLGFLRPEAGWIELDGIRLDELAAKTVRAQIGLVTQGGALLPGTIRENITMTDPSISEAQVIEAAKLAQVHDEIAAMPMGYGTILVDTSTLSGGQRQRISIARALLRKPKLLLFDEATSSLDAVRELELQKALEGIKVTRIVIAHRLSTVVHADQIFVMEAGRVVERGTHAELLASRGKYHELVHAQLASTG